MPIENINTSIRTAKHQSDVNDLLPRILTPLQPLKPTTTPFLTSGTRLFSAVSVSTPPLITGTKTTGELPLTEKLWNASVSIAQKSLTSCFINGIANANLNPNDYGKYTVQDVIYCYKATQNLKLLLENPDNDSYKPFLENRIASYEKYTKFLFEQWNIGDPSAIKLGEAAELYIVYQEHIFKNCDILYALISMLPCEMLWTWLANQLEGNISDTNVYSFWISDNMGTEPGKIGTFLNNNSVSIDFAVALPIFLNCMRGEYNFFCSPCGELDLIDSIEFDLDENLSDSPKASHG